MSTMLTLLLDIQRRFSDECLDEDDFSGATVDVLPMLLTLPSSASRGLGRRRGSMTSSSGNSAALELSALWTALTGTVNAVAGSDGSVEGELAATEFSSVSFASGG